MSKTSGEDLKQRAMGLVNSGRYSEALPLLKGLCSSNPEDGSAWLLCGIAQGGLGDYVEASEYFKRSLALDPSMPEGHFYLGQSLQSLGRFDEAARSFRKAVAIRPDYWQAHYGLARALHRAERFGNAIAAYRKAIKINPQSGELHAHLALALKSLGRIDQAVASIKEAICLQPDAAELYFNLGNLLLGQRELVEAEACFRRAIELKPGWMSAQLALSRTLLLRSDVSAALELCHRVQAHNPGSAEIITAEAGILECIGDFQGAAEKLQPLVESASCDAEALVTWSKLASHLGNHEHTISLLEDRLKSPSFDRDDLRRLHFAVADLYHAVKDYDKAFAHYQQGNALKKGSFSLDDWMFSVNRTIEFFSAAFLLNKGSATVRSRIPVFIVGMPRTGSTLLEQILGRHSGVYGAGELPDIKNIARSLPGLLASDQGYPDCLNELKQAVIDQVASGHIARLKKLLQGAARVIDKMPGNYLHLGLIQILFPEATILHTLRDPVDTCLSCFTRDIGGGGSFSADLKSLGVYYKGYSKLMQHWNSVLQIDMHEVRYEELVEDPETEIRDAIDFCGLEWEDQCLDHMGNMRVVATPSYDQVRKPLYKSSVAKWKHYEKHLGPLIEALGV